ncbi:MAG: YkgJ family cysteine cluster protein [Bacteroidales bacterium]|nr:YkgJ family cysteine cluster protein [Bacteroidales bacterium]
MECRKHCGACCVAPSISSPIPGMPEGKPAGVPCIHLTDVYLCALFGKEERPEVCKGFAAEPSLCGESRDQALANLWWLESYCKS